MLGKLDALRQPAWRALVAGDELQLRAVDEDLVLGGLDRQDVGRVAGGNRIEVGFELHHPVVPADPQRHFGRIVGARREGLEMRLFQDEPFEGRLACGVVDVLVALLGQPPLGGPAQIVQVLELPTAQQVGLDVAKRRLDLPLRLRVPGPASDGLAVVMGDERRKGGVEDGLAGFPAQDHRLFVVVEALPRDPAKMGEGVLMPSNERVEIAGRGEVDVMPPREGQDVGEAQDRRPARTPEAKGVGTPVHLALLARLGLEADDGLWLGRRP